ncbi:hypothetical protein V7457_21290 [Bacillus toyonensis]|uniref:hypothetical protein n=1 Tax=Bacillus toyonensis TaxID=155322 RepID=UPI000BF1E650|nr:hypothetical protein [Bacillus toyonensis]PEM87429.1 hypothetical protein CN629_24265 [Bacillus toyonensis]
MRERIETILLFVSVLIMIAWFVMTVWGDLFQKDVETIKEEQEREARRLERMEMIKNMK